MDKIDVVIPYHDENETLRTPVVTFMLIALNVLSWLLVQGAGASEALTRSVCNLGLIAGELTGQALPGSGFPMSDTAVCVVDPGLQSTHIFTSMFLHGSWMHLIGNMWFLWLFGNNIEDSMSRGKFLIFYLACGVAAALFQVASDPDSIIPMVGASGAISGVMGAYLVLYPTVRVFTLVPLGFFVTSIALPAWVMLLYWAFIQFVSGVSMAAGESTGGVAFWAHIGGFAAGIVLVYLFRNRGQVAAHRRHHWQPSRTGW
ncbi:MAG: rhomboid family intramembrane serine protease [Vicinamibacterales bacterium]